MLDKQNIHSVSGKLLKDSIASISQRRFFGTSVFPLPSYLLFVLGSGRSEPIFGLVNMTFYILACLLTLKTHRMFSRSVPFISAILLLASLLLHGSFIPPSNLALCLFFTSSFLFAAMAQSMWCASILAGMVLSSGPHGIVCIATMAVLSATRLFAFASNPRNSPKKIAVHMMSNTVQVLAVPVVLFLLVMAGDLRIRNGHSDHSRLYPLEFQSALSGFRVENALHPEMDIQDGQLAASSTDAYVMDRSTISIMNAKHRGFLLCPSNDASPEDTRLLEVQKIHESEFEDEEPRFITNGNIVKLKSAGSDVFLGLINKEGSDDKFIDASFGTFPDDNDFWRVECSGELKARSEAAKFVHVNTGLVLCCTRIKGTLHMHGSVYSERSSRLFYITHNTNHSYYKNNFKSQHARAKTSAFPTWGYAARLWMFIKRAGWGHKDTSSSLNDSFLRRFRVSGHLYGRLDRGISYLSFSTTFLLVVLLFLNHVSGIRYKVSFQVSRLAGCLLIFVLSNIACLPFFGLDRHYLTFYSITFNFAVLLLFTSRPAVVLAIPNREKTE